MSELPSLRQEAGHIDIGVHAILQLAIELQEKPVLKKHGGVALVSVQDLRGRYAVVRLLRQKAAAHPDQLAVASFQNRATCHQSENFLSKIRVPNGVIQNAILADAGDDRSRRTARQRLGGRPGLELDRERINFGRAIGISDLQMNLVYEQGLADNPNRDANEWLKSAKNMVLAGKTHNYQLDASGYQAAQDALQEQFPYYIKSHPVIEKEGETVSREKDKGYIEPGRNRPTAVRAGMFGTEPNQPGGGAGGPA